MQTAANTFIEKVERLGADQLLICKSRVALRSVRPEGVVVARGLWSGLLF
jgi:hypothetical protein